jgi:hypothetical protein
MICGVRGIKTHGNSKVIAKLFFHAWALDKKQRNHISTLLVDGQQLLDHKSKKAHVFFHYFGSLMGSENEAFHSDLLQVRQFIYLPYNYLNFFLESFIYKKMLIFYALVIKSMDLKIQHEKQLSLQDNSTSILGNHVYCTYMSTNYINKENQLQ